EPPLLALRDRRGPEPRPVDAGVVGERHALPDPLDVALLGGIVGDPDLWAARGGDDPDIGLAPALGDEREPLAVGRPARAVVLADVAGELAGRAPGGRHHPDVAGPGAPGDVGQLGPVGRPA